MACVQWNHVIEQLAATASDPALGDTILPGAPNRGSRTGYFHRADCGRDLQSILGVMIQNQEPGRGLVRKGFAQLLDNPTAGGMPGNIAMQDASAVVADDEEAIEYIECQSGDREKIHGGDGFAVIAQKS